MKQGRFPTPKRSLSQVFLKVSWPGQWILDEIQTLGAHQVLEIGPGPGVLTKQLLDKKLHVTAVEKDDDLAKALPAATFDAKDAEQTTSRLTVHNQDVLKFDLKNWLDANQEKKVIVGNIPYKISSPILSWLLPHLSRVEAAFFLVQLEFAERVAASHHSKTYGSLSVFAQLRSHVSMGPVVDKTCFFPVPKVDSALIALKPKDHQFSAEALLRCEELTKHLFSMRRKKLSNGLKKFFPDPRSLEDFVNLDLRPENLEPHVFMQLAKKSLEEPS